jgi:outer membrane protein
MKAAHIIMITGLLVFSMTSFGQDSERKLTMENAFALALKNSTELKITDKAIAIARQKTEVAKLGRLPGISTALNYGYISNSQIWEPSFSKHTTAPIPHNLTQFSLQASEVIFKGGEISNTIKKSALEEQVAVLNHDKNLQGIKFIVAARYLDIYRQIIQRTVYVNNARLSQERLKNILSLHKQGVVTNNDVLRTKLILSDLELAVRKTDDNIAILNQQLNVVLGLDDDQRLLPDSTLLESGKETWELAELLRNAYRKNQEIQIAAKETTIARTNLKITEADRLPEISFFAGSNLQRPYTNSIPARDIYYNVWVTGLSVRYNIASIYQSPRKAKAVELQVEQSHEKEIHQKEQVELAVKAAFIKYNEAQDELQTYKDDLQSAEENYRLVEKKYFNQLALLTDLIDATNTKVEAELKVANSQINVVYTRYQVLKTTGSL